MENTREKLLAAVHGMTADELAVLMALLQIRIHELGPNAAQAVQPVPPDGMSKAGCKRLIKAIRTKNAGIFDETRMDCERIVSHIRNVWIPQIRQRFFRLISAIEIVVDFDSASAYNNFISR